MTQEEYSEFERKSHEYLIERQSILQLDLGIGDYERWDYDQETGEFFFSNNGVEEIVAKFQIVGTLSNVSGTWLWSWANPHLTEIVKDKIYKVRQFGEENDLAELTGEKWTADETDAWAMTCLALNILQAEGAYKCPHDSGSVFVVFTEINKLNERIM